MKNSRLSRTLLIVLTSLLAFLLVGLFLVPILPLEGTKPIEQLADPDSRFIEINGLTVHYKITGQGEPTFVLLHGFGASLYAWWAVMQPLGALGAVIAYDRPAFGLTERPLTWEGESPYSPSTTKSTSRPSRVRQKNSRPAGTSKWVSNLPLTALYFCR